MFFPDEFRVTVDREQGALRVSVRAGENRIDEWWITGSEARSVLESPNNGIWRGEGSLRVRVKRPGALVALYDETDNRTIIRATEPTVRLFLAQLRAALAELGDQAVPSPKPYEGPVVPFALAGLEDMLRGEIRAGFAHLQTEIVALIRAELNQAVAVPPAIKRPEPPGHTDPVFIPSRVGQDLGGEIKVQPRVGAGDSVAESMRALKVAKEKK